MKIDFKNILNYPFDVKTILRKKKAIKKSIINDINPSLKKNVAILGGSSSHEIKDILELYLLRIGITPSFYESEYNRYFEEAVLDQSKLLLFSPDIVYIHTSIKNIAYFPNPSSSDNEVEKMIEDEFLRFQSIWESLEALSCIIIQNNFELPNQRIMGNIDATHHTGRIFFINELNRRFAERAAKDKNLLINDINYLSASVGLENWYDNKIWFQAKYAFNLEYTPLLANNLVNIIKACMGKAKKCLVLDLDNTLWGGVIGDDGLKGIKIGNDSAIGESYNDFQRYVLELKKRGVLLAVCSKNDMKIAKEGFDHPDSVLSLEDFSSFKANWNPKVDNIREIAYEINIGTESLVFIDDNPAERQIVNDEESSISVPNVGDDVTKFSEYIDKNGYFETIHLSQDDFIRTDSIKSNKKRAKDIKKFENYDKYLISLNMVSEISSFNDQYLERITQLINKTNQFNLTTLRMTESEIEEIYKSDKYIKIYGRLEDNYGDNGLTSVLIGKLEKNKVTVILWIMSCRVFKRNMEFAMFDKFVDFVKEKEISLIEGSYIKTEKNSIVADLYKELGFKNCKSTEESSVWEINTEDYIKQNNIIQIKNN